MTDPVPNGSELCTHGEELHVPCEKCHSEQRPSKDMMRRLRENAATGLDMSPGDPIAAWAVGEIDRLNADLAWIRRRTQFWGEVPADLCTRHGQIVQTDCPDCERALGRASQPPEAGQ